MHNLNGLGLYGLRRKNKNSLAERLRSALKIKLKPLENFADIGKPFHERNKTILALKKFVREVRASFIRN
jgi:hypothetical protein